MQQGIFCWRADPWRHSGLRVLPIWRRPALTNKNVLFALIIEDITSHQLEGLNFEVTFDGVFGLLADFKCCTIEAESVTPFESSAEINGPIGNHLRARTFCVSCHGNTKHSVSQPWRGDTPAHHLLQHHSGKPSKFATLDM
jgi:hypothetical protein